LECTAIEVVLASPVIYSVNFNDAAAMGLDMCVRAPGRPCCTWNLEKIKLEKLRRVVKKVLAIWIEADEILANSETSMIEIERRAILRMNERTDSKK
jgi:hypothetical protein